VEENKKLLILAVSEYLTSLENISHGQSEKTSLRSVREQRRARVFEVNP
jgi:hypothetical protein